MEIQLNRSEPFNSDRTVQICSTIPVVPTTTVGDSGPFKCLCNWQRRKGLANDNPSPIINQGIFFLTHT